MKHQPWRADCPCRICAGTGLQNPAPMIPNPCPGLNLTQYKLRNTVDEERWLIECRDCGWSCWFPAGVPFDAFELHLYRYGSEPDSEPAASFERPEPNPI